MQRFDNNGDVALLKQKFMVALYSGDYTGIHSCLENGMIDPNSTEFLDNNGNTPLHNAYNKRNTAMITTLLIFKADPLKKNNKGETIIDLAVRDKRQDVLLAIFNACSHLRGTKVLMDALQKINEKTNVKKEDEVFANAILNNDLDTVRNCLETGQSPDCVIDNDLNKPLHYAVKTNNLKLLLLLLMFKANPYSVDKENNSVYKLCYLRNDCAKFLLSHHSNISNRAGLTLDKIRANDTKATLQLIKEKHFIFKDIIHLVVANKNDVVLKELLEAGIDPLLLENGKTPIEYALELRAWKCIEVFIDIFIKQKRDLKPLHQIFLPMLQCATGLDLVQKLIEHDRSVLELLSTEAGKKTLQTIATRAKEFENYKNVANFLASLEASKEIRNQPTQPTEFKKVDAVQAVVRNDAETNKFVEALLNNDLIAIRTALEKGQSPNCAIDSELNTPLHYAISTDNKKLVILLLMFNANPNVINKAEQSSLNLSNTISSDYSHLLAINTSDKDQRDKLNKAIEKNYTNEAISLLNNGFIPFNQATKWAVHHKNAALLQALLNFGMDSEVKIDGVDAVSYAIQQRAWNCIDVFIDMFAKEKRDLKLFHQAFFSALLNGKLEIAKKLIAHDPSILKLLLTEDGKKTLQTIDKHIKEGYENYNDLSEFLFDLESSEDVKSSIRTYVSKPKSIQFIEAVLGNDLDTVRTCLEAGQSPNSKIDNNTENTALHHAIQTNNMKLMVLLLMFGAKYDIKNKNNATTFALSHQIINDCANFLVQHHRNIASNVTQTEIINTFKTNDTQTILNWIKSGRFIVKNIVHWAVYKNNAEVLKALLNAGMDPFILDQGKTAIEYAIELRSWNCIAVFFDMYVKEKRDLKPFNSLFLSALENNRFDIVIKLITNDSSVLKLLASENGKKALTKLKNLGNENELVLLLKDLAAKDKAIAELLLAEVDESLRGFRCPMRLDEISEPIIIPRGVTCEKKDIEKYKKDPETRRVLQDSDLRVDKLYSVLLKHYQFLFVDLSLLPTMLINPRTGVAYQKPVVDSNGDTYEKDYIEKFVLANGGKTPANVPHVGEFYPHRLAMSLIEEVDSRLLKLLNQVNDNNLQETLAKLKAIIKSGAALTRFMENDGKDCLKALAAKAKANPAYTAVINEIIRAMFYRSAELRESVFATLNVSLHQFEDNEFNKKFQRQFEDAIDFEQLDHPVIVPEGQTFSEKALEGQDTNPITQSKLDPSSIVPNYLVTELMFYYSRNDVDHNKIPPILYNGNDLFQDPVVASDGRTYERASIEKYLAAHNNMTPANVLQQGALYPNRFVKDLITLLKELNKKNEKEPQKAEAKPIVAAPSNTGVFAPKSQKEEIDDSDRPNAYLQRFYGNKG